MASPDHPKDIKDVLGSVMSAAIMSRRRLVPLKAIWLVTTTPQVSLIWKNQCRTPLPIWSSRKPPDCATRSASGGCRTGAERARRAAGHRPEIHRHGLPVMMTAVPPAFQPAHLVPARANAPAENRTEPTARFESRAGNAHNDGYNFLFDLLLNSESKQIFLGQ